VVCGHCAFVFSWSVANRAENDNKFAQYKGWFKKSPPPLTIEDLNEHLDELPYDSVRKHRILLR